MKRTIAKNTLSFSTSKTMMYLRTPTDIWESLSNEFDFTLDACASDENHLLPKYYTKENSCLDKDWSGECVYLHPLFDMHIGKFIEKAYNENINNNVEVVVLIPASTHTRYFHKYLYHNPRVEIRFLEKPNKGFRFLHDGGIEDDPTKIGYIKPLMVVVFHKQDRKTLGDIVRETPNDMELGNKIRQMVKNG
jgi:phage N-6-adenine-methyltransferase